MTPPALHYCVVQWTLMGCAMDLDRQFNFFLSFRRMTWRNGSGFCHDL